MKSTWIAGLNPEQAEAVQHVAGPLLILAGAGSGKTTVLISRCGYLIEEHQVPASQIQVLTFTNKAARELKHRVAQRLGPRAKGLQASTFHSFGLHFLRRYHSYFDYPANFGIIDQSDALGVMRELAKQVNISTKDKFDFEKIYELVLDYRVFGRPKRVATDEYLTLAEWMFPKYLKALKHLGVVDFEDLILKPTELLKNNLELKQKNFEQTQFWMVDEFQDTNDVQMHLLHQLVNPQHNNLAVVGDDDQAIYGFRGAMVKHILSFPKEFSPCKTIRLERNYRSTSAILALANQVIGQNTERHRKILKPSRDFDRVIVPELFVLADENHEAEFVVSEIFRLRQEGLAWNEISILYRSNSQGQHFETELKAAQIPYRVTGGISLFDRKEIKDVVAYLRLMFRYHELSMRRIINMPPRGIGETSLDHLLLFMEAHSVNFLEALKNWQSAGVDSKIGLCIESFMQLYAELPQLVEKMQEAGQCSSVMWEYLRKIGYVDYLVQVKIKNDKESISFEKRLTPIRIFLESLDRYVQKQKVESELFEFKSAVLDYLDLFELRTDQDDKAAAEVQLMTLHASKGLEFDAVFLPGIEEDILPHKILGLEVDEERRLFYVGITRARKNLVLTRSEQRKRYGALRAVAPSRFLNDITESTLKSYSQGVRPIEKSQIETTVQDFLKGLGQKVQQGKKL